MVFTAILLSMYWRIIHDLYNILKCPPLVKCYLCMCYSPSHSDSYALYVYWQIRHSASFQNAPNKPMKFHVDDTRAKEYIFARLVKGIYIFQAYYRMVQNNKYEHV